MQHGRLGATWSLATRLCKHGLRSEATGHSTAPKSVDSDGDGFVDKFDDCPHEPGQGPRGCPVTDLDKDGFSDIQDTCPETPGTAPDGCPLPDTDNDGLRDYEDVCDHESETYNGFQDHDGCPDSIPPDLARFTGVIRGVEFSFNSAEIKRESNQVLNEAAAVLKKHPSVRVEITAHTMNIGSAKYNNEQTTARAQAVMRNVIDYGVEPSRLQARGAGFLENPTC